MTGHGTFQRYLDGCLCDKCFTEARRVHAARQATTKPYKGGPPRQVTPYRPKKERRLTRDDQKERVERLLTDGLSQAEIARQTGLGYVTVHRLAKSLGISRQVTPPGIYSS